MDDKVAVHTLARRYCQEHFSEWCKRYAELYTGGDYSPEAYNTFPRYLFLQDTLRAVEILRPELILSVELLVQLMTDAARTAGRDQSDSLKNPIARDAISDESAKFIRYIRSLTKKEFDSAIPLPWRRTLTTVESSRIWSELKTRWGIGEDYWYPISSLDLPADIVAFHTDYFDEIKESALRELLAIRGIGTVWELRESQSYGYQMELPMLRPRYNGDEGYWTSGGFDWVVYASHEASVTLAGAWLVTRFREMFPACDRFRYRGPFSTEDLRGASQ